MYNLQIRNIALGSCELNKKLKIARRNGFKINHINKLTKKFYANQSQMTIIQYLKHRIPILH